MTARTDVLEFFDRYQRGADTSDPDVVRDCFAETFLNLDPHSAGPVPRETLIQALPDRARLFATIGVEALELTDLTEAPIDELHTLVATTWSARFSADTEDAEPLALPSHFLLRRQGASWQIVTYLNSTDLVAIFAQRVGHHQERQPQAPRSGGRG
jgi:hypothetical protein